MHCTLKNYYSKHFYILSILLFIKTVACAEGSTTVATKADDHHFKLRNIRTFSFDEWENVCKTFDIVLTDVDVFFNGLSNANKTHVKALKKLEDAKKKFIFYTTTMDTTDDLYEILKKLGYTTDSELFNPINALEWYFKKNDFSGKAYIIGDETFNAMIKNLHIGTIYHQGTVTLDQYITGYNATLDNQVKAVIIGFDVNINLYKMTQALRYLKDPKVQLFVTQGKPIFGSNYFDAMIKRMIAETKKTKQYIDRLDGIFGDFLVEKNALKDNVLCVTSNAAGNQNFIMKNKFKPLLIGSYKVKKEVTLPSTYYYIDNIAKIPHCNDE